MENYTMNASSIFGDTDQQNAPNEYNTYLNIIDDQSAFTSLLLGKLYLRINNGRTKEPNKDSISKSWINAN